MTVRVLIVDDEPGARAKLRRLLRAIPDIETIGEAEDGRAAVALTASLTPDIVLLDIRMPELDGFAALDAIRDDLNPLIIFVTGFDVHALRAFEVHAFDYLLKPFDEETLRASLDRARAQLELQQRPDAAAFRAVVQQLHDEGREHTIAHLDRVLIRSAGRMQCVQLADVEWIEACGNYVRLHSAGGRSLMRATLARLITELDPRQFARIHRSAIVNLNCIRALQPVCSGDNIIHLRSGTRLKLSRSYREELTCRLAPSVRR